MAKVKGLVAALAAATALAACGGRGPATTGAGAAAPATDQGHAATRLKLLTAPAVCPPTCTAAEGIADFHTQTIPADGLSYNVVDRSDGDIGDVSINYEEDPYGTQGTPINVVVAGTSVTVSGTFYGIGLSTFRTFTFTIDNASGGVRSLDLGGEILPLSIQFFDIVPGQCTTR